MKPPKAEASDLALMAVGVVKAKAKIKRAFRPLSGRVHFFDESKKRTAVSKLKCITGARDLRWDSSTHI
jgi:hypothetical protein